MNDTEKFYTCIGAFEDVGTQELIRTFVINSFILDAFYLARLMESGTYKIPEKVKN